MNPPDGRPRLNQALHPPALVQYAGGNFGEVYPGWPFPMHKNFAGTVMAFPITALMMRASVPAICAARRERIW